MAEGGALLGLVTMGKVSGERCVGVRSMMGRKVAIIIIITGPDRGSESNTKAQTTNPRDEDNGE